MSGIYDIKGSSIIVDSISSDNLEVSTLGIEDDDITANFSENPKLCLSGVKYNINQDRLPNYPVGWLYVSESSNPSMRDVWYSANRLDNPKLLTTMSRISNENLRSFAISPLHGDIISLMMDNRNAPIVYDADSDLETEIQGLQTNPIGWLGSSGCDFGIDSQGNEYFIFGEYTGASPSSTGNVNVWKVTYPYTNPENWNIVLSLERASTNETSEDGKVWHIHTAQRDPYTGVWYVTTGDTDSSTTWRYSTDDGETWNLLLVGTAWLGQTARLLNFAFAEDYIWWGNDYGTNHSVNRISRDEHGIIDTSTHEIIAQLNPNQSTYATCLLTYPSGLLFLDRVDIAFSGQTNKLTVQFFDFNSMEVRNLKTFHRHPNRSSYFGFRCRAYTLRQSPLDCRIGVGWDGGQPNWIDMLGNEDEKLVTAFLHLLQ